MKQFLIISLLSFLSLNTYSQNGKIKGTKVNFRSDTVIVRNNIIEQLSYHDKISILEKGSIWTKIRHLNDIGYVHSEYIYETFSFSTFINNLNAFQIALIIILITSLFLPRLLMLTVIYAERESAFKSEHRKFSMKLNRFLYGTNIESVFEKFIGKNINKTTAWVLRFGSLLTIPVLLFVISLIFDYYNLEKPIQLTIDLFISTLYKAIVSGFFVLIVFFILAGLIYEVIVLPIKVEIIRAPLLLVLSFYMIPIAIYTILWFLSVLIFKLLFAFGEILYVIISFVLKVFITILVAVGFAGLIGSIRDDYHKYK